jgi:outer membrane lipopolysaccharide assembly protein LptE/RlpB
VFKHKSLPFIQAKETLHKSLNTYINVIAHLSAAYKRSLESNKIFLIADQPAKNSPSYHLWNDLYQNDNLVKVISLDDSGEVAELIIESGASKFIE